MQKVPTVKQLIGEYPVTGTCNTIGLFDFTPGVMSGNRPVTNLEVLQLFAAIGGGALCLSDPVSPEGIRYNANLLECESSGTFSDFLLRAVKFEQPL